MLEHECGWQPHQLEADIIFEGCSYDARQTDNAWVEIHIFRFHCEDDEVPPFFHPGGEFEEVAWCPLSTQTINDVHHGQAQFIRDVVNRIQEEGRLDEERAQAILSETG